MILIERIGKTYKNRYARNVGEKIIGVLYAVYEGHALWTSTDEAEIIFVTAHLPDAIEYAHKHKGAVYSYDITQQEDYINERFVCDGTHG